MTDTMLLALAALASGLGLGQILPGVWQRLTSRADDIRRENRQLRADNNELEDRSDQLRAERDREAARARIVAEYASLLRRTMYDHGLRDQVPPWPGK